MVGIIGVWKCRQKQLEFDRGLQCLAREGEVISHTMGLTKEVGRGQDWLWDIQTEAEKRKNGWRSVLEAAVWIKGKIHANFREGILS